MGGSLSAFGHVRVELKEGSAGWVVAGAHQATERSLHLGIASFTEAAQGCELLLRLTQDDEPLPEVFQATLCFLHACEHPARGHVIAYTFCLLHLLGFLPEAQDLPVTGTDLAFIETARKAAFESLPAVQSEGKLREVAATYLRDQLNGPLKAPGVVAELSRGQK
jgi:recombinational DNA repair protein (RecF pathway)